MRILEIFFIICVIFIFTDIYEDLFVPIKKMFYELKNKKLKESERIEGWHKWLINEINDVETKLNTDLDPTHRAYYKSYKSDMEKELKIIETNSKIEKL